MKQIFNSIFVSQAYLRECQPRNLINHYQSDLEASGQTCWFDNCHVCRPYDGMTSKLLKEIKYRGNQHKSKGFSGEIKQVFLGQGYHKVGVHIVYPPIHWSSYLLRGGNHAKGLTLGIHRYGRVIYPLKRIKKNEKQYNKSRAGRIKSEKFIIRPRYTKDLLGAHIILVDDVISSGGTANHIAKLLKTELGASHVDVIAVASRAYTRYQRAAQEEKHQQQAIEPLHP